jgi:hypothetical protein
MGQSWNLSPSVWNAHLYHFQYTDFLVQNQLITEALFSKEPFHSAPDILSFFLPVPLGLKAVL